MTGNEGHVWDEIYTTEGQRAEYPDEFVIRFVNGTLLQNDSDPSSMRVLDLGCGPGRHVAYLAREGFEVYGIDYSEVAIEMARKLCASTGIDADLRRGDITDLPYPDGHFDAVIDCASIQHNYNEDIIAAVSEVRRVLDTGGHFFWKARAQTDSFFGEGEQPEPGTSVFHQESVVTDDSQGGIEKPTHFFGEDELRSRLSEFTETRVEYTERTFDGMDGTIAHYVVVATK